MFWHARSFFRAVRRCVCRCACYDLCSRSHVHMHPCTHAYHALTRVLGPCAVACADAFARTYVLALHMPAACADACARAYVLARMQHIRAAMYFRNTCARHGVGASEPKKITSPGLRLRVSFNESEQHRVQGGVVAGLERDMLQPW